MARSYTLIPQGNGTQCLQRQSQSKHSSRCPLWYHLYHAAHHQQPGRPTPRPTDPRCPVALSSFPFRPDSRGGRCVRECAGAYPHGAGHYLLLSTPLSGARTWPVSEGRPRLPASTPNVRHSKPPQHTLATHSTHTYPGLPPEPRNRWAERLLQSMPPHPSHLLSAHQPALCQSEKTLPK